MSTNELREMGQQSISKSFKGILRIAHIKDNVGLNKSSNDNFLNQLLYRNFDENFKINRKEMGYPTAYPYGLSEENPIDRYKSDDPYINAKLPVTDSLGNYLNFNVGVSGVSFGTNNKITSEYIEITEKEDENSNSFYFKKNFPILSSEKSVIVGFDRKKATAEKTTNSIGGKVNLERVGEGLNDTKSVIIINHDEVTLSGNNYQNRTVYKLNDPGDENYAPMVLQENYNRKNLAGAETGGTTIRSVDNVVEMVDLKSYVEERVKMYLNNNTIPVPTGTVIWEHVSLKNY